MIDQQDPGSSTSPEKASTDAAAPAGAPIPAPRRADVPGWQAAMILAVVLMIGGYFRFVGLNWDEYQHLHPDERFMTSVADAIRPVSLWKYFDTANSTLNPFPYGSFTYGMFPLFLTRYVAEDLSMASYNPLTLVGRALSGAFDLAAVVMLFFLGARLYNRQVGLLAAALAAAAVLPIQLSHYFAVDSFASVFIVAAFYVAAPAMDRGSRWRYAGFGLLTGLAMACKINTAPLAGIIVIAGVIRVAKAWPQAGDRRAVLNEVLFGWLVAGAVTALTFRVFQPYAFNGPTIFGVGINKRWYDIMREVTDQVAGRSEWPPNHHWTNRPQLTYAWTQLAVWGVGLPLGLAATIAWLWAAWRAWHDASRTRGEWQGHILLVVWVGAYFAWQNAQFWRYMRYFTPIYPFALLLAAWGLIEFVKRARARPRSRRPRLAAIGRGFALLTLIGVTLGAYGYAFAFTRIYTRPHSRVEASRWMLQNIPGPLNIHIDTPQGEQIQPLALPYDLVLKPGEPWRISFEPVAQGTVSQITSFQIYAPDTTFEFKLTRDSEGADIVAKGGATIPASPPGGGPALAAMSRTTIPGGRTYFLHYTVRAGGALAARSLAFANGDETALAIEGEISAPDAEPVSGVLPVKVEADTPIDRLTIGAVDIHYPAETSTVRLVLSQGDADPLAEAETIVNLAWPASLRTFSFAPVAVEPGKSFSITLEVTSGSPVAPAGATLAMETSWDDALPLRVDKYDPLGGIYRLTNLELFEPDTVTKRIRMVDALTRADYLVVSSNRAYDAMPRLPLRYPMTLKYYQALFGCEEQFIYLCAYPAQPPLQGPLGYELIRVFESNPAIGPFSFSDQTAEEAFTVYDHPKVMIFKRTDGYSPEQAAGILESVDLTQVLEQTPVQYTAMPTALRLSPDRLAAQTSGGSWSDIFDPYSLLNSSQPSAVAAWYLLLCFIGWVAFPLLFVALRGLPDRGYPIAKLIGLLIITWLAWFTGSYKLLPFTRQALWLIITILVCAAGFFAYRHQAALTAFVRSQRRYLFLVEGLTLALFLFFLAVRWYNPDLWHPWLGGEKPADFSFFQSAIRTVYFPPYDPWLSGHYVNYYYYGYVVAAVPTKLLGILPSIAYNLVLPTLFAFAGIGAFCAAYNIVAAQSAESAPPPESGRPAGLRRLAVAAGLASLVMMVLLGNLFQARLLWRHLSEAADPPVLVSEETGFAEHVGAVLGGGWRVLTGQTPLPGEKGRWYFAASRAILHNKPDTPITEFPFFSFLYADLHPHLTSMSLMLAGLAWMTGLILQANGGRSRADNGSGRGLPERIALWFVGGLIVGALQPTHTWDFPGLVGLGVASVIASVWLERREFSRITVRDIAVGSALFVGLAVVMYYPFRQTFATEFSSVEFWKGMRTPIADYLTVHGLFLFLIVTLLLRETWILVKSLPMDFLLHTPLGELLPRIRTHLIVSAVGAVVILIGAALIWKGGYESMLIAGPLLLWSGLLFIRRGQPLPRRIWLAMVAAGVGLTMVVELITLRGDIGRSNTVFKFYIEVWAFFSVAAGAALAWMLPAVLHEWPQRLRRGWLAGLALLVAAAGAYTVTGTWAKVTDRWPDVDDPPRTLDGMAYMLGPARTGSNPVDAGSPAYDDEGARIILAYDYGAIRWLQQNVKGTPAIVEGNTPLYRWGTRMAIYTGLPSVVGWDWHLKQHDSVLPPVVIDRRIEDVREFYNTTDPDGAMEFLKRYDVRYIIVGTLERKYYEAEGLEKFAAMVESDLLELVYPQSIEQPEDSTYVYRLAGEGN